MVPQQLEGLKCIVIEPDGRCVIVVVFILKRTRLDRGGRLVEASRISLGISIIILQRVSTIKIRIR